MKDKKIKKWLQFFENSPIGFTVENSNLEVRGNKEIKLEGYKKILSISHEQIKISLKGMYISISGTNLKIKCLNYDSLLIQGIINKIEFNV